MASNRRRTARSEETSKAQLCERVERLESDLRQSRERVEKLEELVARIHRLGKLVCWDRDAATEELVYHGSAEAAEATGYAPDHEVKRFFELLHPDDIERVRATYAEADRAGSGFQLDYRFNSTRGGQIRSKEIAEAVHDEDGNLVAHRGIVQDITELAQTKQALQQRQAWLNQAQEFAGIGYWVWKDESIARWTTDAVESGRSPLLSDECRKVYGFHEDEKGVTAARLHIDDRARCHEVWDTADRQQKGYDVEYRLVHRDDSVRYLREVGQPSWDSETGKTIWFGIAQDVTAYRETENALRRSEMRYRTIFDSIPVAVFEEDWSACKRIIDGLKADGVEDIYSRLINDPGLMKQLWAGMKSLTQNPAAYAVYKTNDTDTLYDFFREWDPASDPGGAELLARYFDALAKGKTSYSGEVQHTVTDGSFIHAQMHIRIPEAFQDTWERVLLAEEDVTQRKNAEDQLRQAQKMEAVGQLTGGIAHDFNNVLSIILGNLDLLRDEVLPLGEAASHVRTAIRAAENGAALAHRLLAFSRKQPLKPQPVDIEQLIEGLRGLAKRTLRENIDLRIQAEEELWPCLVDPGQLENALLNLAINARDAMPEGGTITIDSSNVTILDGDQETDLRPGGYVRIAVADTGTGIPAETLHHVFEPFFTTKDVGKGSGLGLSMIYGFGKQSGGDVMIETEMGEGTTVSLYLPRFLGREGAPAEESPEEQVLEAQGETILVVEDDPDLRAMISATLKSLGYVTFEAESAKMALELLNSRVKVDLLLTDVVLPGGVNGRQLVADVLQRRPWLPALLMSGYADRAMTLPAPLDPDIPLLQKPFRQAVIAAAVRKAIGRGTQNGRP